MNARDLSRLPIWKGNRFIDHEHRASIKAKIGRNIKALDLKPYHIVTYKREDENGDQQFVSEIVDGQHRAAIIKSYYENEAELFDLNEFPEDFNVLVVDKKCETEQDIIEYFKVLNTTKAIEWREDPVLVANKYLDALLTRFNGGKKNRIRQGKTRYPYVSVDTLREEMIRRRIGVEMRETPEEYAERIYLEHEKGLRELREAGPKSKEQESALKADCILLIQKNYEWLTPK